MWYGTPWDGDKSWLVKDDRAFSGCLDMSLYLIDKQCMPFETKLIKLAL